IGPRDWEPTAGGESGHIAARPGEPDVVYGGSYGGFLMRYDHASEELRSVNVWPDDPMGHGAEDARYRFQWNFPISFSPHDPDTLYAAGNVLFRSNDGGASWQLLGGDLTRDDRTKMGPSGGPITKDNTSVEYYGTIFAAAESPLQAGVLWTGSDDGLVHLSRDGGETWQNVTPRGMPEWILVNSVEPHPTEPGGLYVAATMYKWDDFRPYLYKTTDWGASWTKITEGIAADHFTRAIRADPERPGLLYAGTECGVYVSFDDGGHWQSLQLELPIVPITDLAIEAGHLAAATQGRGFWMLDDLAPLRQLGPEVASRELHLFHPSPAWRIDGPNPEEPIGRGSNPPNGAIVDFYLREPAEGTEVALEFLDSAGTLVRRFEGKVELKEEDGAEESEPAAAQEETAETKEQEEDEEEKKDPAIGEMTAKAGHNRFAWDLRYAPAKEFEGLILWGEGGEGSRVVPGRYQVKLILGEGERVEGFEVMADPRSSATPADLEAQLAFLLEARDRLTAVHTGIERIRDVRGQLEALRDRLPEGEETAMIREAAAALDEKMTAIEEALYQTKSKSPQDPLNFPIRLNDKLSSLAGLVAMGDGPPTAQALTVEAELSAAIDAELAKLERLWAEDLPALNAQVAAAQVPAIAVEQER
ncbi:MAG: WD40/YVTN/BNR-like repeat-containing protein, partial [Thermoanaerobaculia bacterium]